MTHEQLEKAKELSILIAVKKEQLEKRLPLQKERNNISVYSNSNYLTIPESIKDTVLLLIENEYKKEIELLEKQFKEL